jgi:hypothetical protein
MPVESGNLINDLNELQPNENDRAGEGSDHLRLIKKVLKNQFPNFRSTASGGESITYSDEILNFLATHLTADELNLIIKQTSLNYYPNNLTERIKILTYDDSGFIKPSEPLPPLGSIEMYALESLDSIYGPGQNFLVPCDGRPITGSVYANQVLGGGEQFAPDMRGRFPRMYNPENGSLDTPQTEPIGTPEQDTTAVNGLKLSNPTEVNPPYNPKDLTHDHNAKNHTHTLNLPGANNERPQDLVNIYEPAWNYTGRRFSYTQQKLSKPDTFSYFDANHRHDLTGDIETRPYSYVAMFWIRIN